MTKRRRAWTPWTDRELIIVVKHKKVVYLRHLMRDEKYFFLRTIMEDKIDDG